MHRVAGKNFYSAPPVYKGWITPRDILISMKLSFCAIGAILPGRYWKSFSKRLAVMQSGVQSPRFTRFSALFEEYFGMKPEQLELQALAANFEENIEAIRDLMPGGWHPPMRLDGRECLDRALQQRRGIILWVGDFQHSDVVTKKAIATAHYELTNLSEIGHPYSTSRFGAWVLNSIRTIVENAYLKRRLIVVHSNTQPAIEALLAALRRSEMIGITAVEAGNKPLSIPMFGTTFPLAAGAPSLALRTGSALIPVFTVPDEQGGYVVHMGPDISEGASADAGPVRLMALRYAALLEGHVIRFPALWKRWFSEDWIPSKPGPE